MTPILTISPQGFTELRSFLTDISKASDEVIIKDGKLTQTLTIGDTILFADLTPLLGDPIDFTISNLKNTVKKPMRAFRGPNNIVFLDDEINEQYVITNKTTQVITNKLISSTKPAEIPDLSNISPVDKIGQIKLTTELDNIRDICSGEENVSLIIINNTFCGIRCGEITYIFETFSNKLDINNLPTENQDGSPLITLSSTSFLCMKPELELDLSVVRVDSNYYLVTRYLTKCSYITYENLEVTSGNDDFKL